MTALFSTNPCRKFSLYRANHKSNCSDLHTAVVAPLKSWKDNQTGWTGLTLFVTRFLLCTACYIFLSLSVNKAAKIKFLSKNVTYVFTNIYTHRNIIVGYLSNIVFFSINMEVLQKLFVYLAKCQLLNICYNVTINCYFFRSP